MVNIIVDFLKEIFINSFKGWFLLIFLTMIVYLIRLWVRARKRIKENNDARKWRQEKINRQKYNL